MGPSLGAIVSTMPAAVLRHRSCRIERMRNPCADRAVSSIGQANPANRVRRFFLSYFLWNTYFLCATETGPGPREAAHKAAGPVPQDSPHKRYTSPRGPSAGMWRAVGGHQQAAEAVLRPDVAGDHTRDDLCGLDLPPTRGALGQSLQGRKSAHSIRGETGSRLGLRQKPIRVALKLPLFGACGLGSIR